VRFARRRPREGDFYAVASHGHRVPAVELTVAEAALADGGPLGDRLIQQLRETADVWRHAGDDGTYELRISTTDDLRIDGVPRDGRASPWMPLIAMPGGRPVELRLVVHEAGIVGIVGRTADAGRWPKTWTVRPDDLAAIRSRAPWLDLPTTAEIDRSRRAAERAIGTWLGDPGAVRAVGGHLSARPPTAAAAIDALAEAEGFRLPEAYRSLLEVADGIEIGRVVILGTEYAYRLDIPGPGRLVISPPDEDGALTLAESGEVVRVDPGDRTSEGLALAPDLRAWLLGSLD